MGQAESRLSRDIVKALQSRGAFAYKTHGSGFTKRGLPDIVGVIDGCFFSFEVKTPDNPYGVTKLQAQRGREIREAGGGWWVVISVDEALDRIDELLG